LGNRFRAWCSDIVLPSIPRLSALSHSRRESSCCTFPVEVEATRSSRMLRTDVSCLLIPAGDLQLVQGSFWIPGYLAVLSGVVMCWVLLKMKYQGTGRSSGSPPLSCFSSVSHVCPSLAGPALGLGDGVRRMLLTVSLESTAFLLAMKILIRKQHMAQPYIAIAFLVALAS